MNEADRTEGYRMLDVAGQLPTRINTALSDAVTSNGGTQPVHQKLLAAHASNNAMGQALVGLENWIRNLTVDGVIIPPPEPVPGKPPGAMLPGQLTIPQCSTDDKLFLSNANPSIVNLAKLYASDQDIALMYAYYTPGGQGWPGSYNPATYTGVFRR